MLPVYLNWMAALACLAVSTALLVRLELRAAAGIPWPPRQACPLRAASTIEYIMIAIVIISSIYGGFTVFGDAAETAFTNLGDWVTDNTGSLGGN